MCRWANFHEHICNEMGAIWECNVCRTDFKKEVEMLGNPIIEVVVEDGALPQECNGLKIILCLQFAK